MFHVFAYALLSCFSFTCTSAHGVHVLFQNLPAGYMVTYNLNPVKPLKSHSILWVMREWSREMLTLQLTLALFKHRFPLFFSSLLFAPLLFSSPSLSSLSIAQALNEKHSSTCTSSSSSSSWWWDPLLASQVSVWVSNLTCSHFAFIKIRQD